jgi:hypothetical protein
VPGVRDTARSDLSFVMDGHVRDLGVSRQQERRDDRLGHLVRLRQFVATEGLVREGLRVSCR